MRRKLPFLVTCGKPTKTLSFRAATTKTITGEFDNMFATGDTVSSIESVIRLSTDRLFFNPGNSSSILEEAKPNKKEKEKDNVLPFKESVSMMEMESSDPFADFKKSIQEMVDADERLTEWENLQELLNFYLAVNDNINHGYIIGAFLDYLLVNIGSPLSSLCSSSSSINRQKSSLLMESGSNRCKNKNKMMISSGSTKSGSLITSSSTSSSGTQSSTCSHCLSSCSLEDDEEENNNHRDDEDRQTQSPGVISFNL